MGLFRKKKQEKDVNEDVQASNDSAKRDDEKGSTQRGAYRIRVWENFGGNVPRKVTKDFIAYRYTDEDELIPYLKNEEQGFLEIFPQKIEDFLTADKNTILKNLSDAENKLKLEKAKEIPEVNFKDLDFIIKKCKAQLRALEFSPESSYAAQDDDNMILFNYLRVGTSLLPLKWDLKTRDVYIPTDNKRKSATVALRNKDTKYPTADNQIKFTSWLFLVLTLIAFLGNLYIGHKNISIYDENELNQLKIEMIKDTESITKEVKSQANSISVIADKLQGQLKPDEVTVVEGKETIKVGD